MTLDAYACNDAWIVRSIEAKEATIVIGDRSSVTERSQYWTGDSWEEDPGHAMKFDSRPGVNAYIDANRERLSS